MTTGVSSLETKRVIEEAGGECLGIVCVVDLSLIHISGVSGEPAWAHCVSGDQPGLPVCLRVLPFWAVRQAPLVPAGAGKTEHPDCLLYTSRCV